MSVCFEMEAFEFSQQKQEKKLENVKYTFSNGKKGIKNKYAGGG